MASDTSTVGGILKRVYGDWIATQQNLRHEAMDSIAKSSKKYNPAGEGFYGDVNDYGNESIGAINENEQFRTIQNEHYQQYKVQPKVLVAPVQYSGLLAKVAEGNEESFANAVVDAIDMARTRLLKDENRQFFGMGTGLLGTPAANILSNATSMLVDSAQYFRANQVVDIYNGNTKTVTAIRLSDVDKQANVIYFATSLGAPLITTDQVVKTQIRDNAPADGKVLGGEEVDTLIMHKKQRRKYLDIVVPQKRYADGNMDAGFKKLSFNGMDLHLDDDCQTSVVYALNKAHLQKYEAAPLEMGREDGSDVFLRLANFDQFQAYWRHYCNFGTDKRNAHGKITGLAVPLGIA